MKHKNTAYIDRLALEQNYRSITKLCEESAREAGKPAPKIICVVKADAYGHGVDTVARVLGDAGCGFFAVSSEEEALSLREIEAANGRHPDILILGHVMPENVALMIENDVTCAVCDMENARELASANSTGKPLSVHVKLDTGMNRVGFNTDDERYLVTVSEIEEISHDERLKITGIFTHFSSADDELLSGKIVEGYEDLGGYTALQLSQYERILCELGSRGVEVGMRHTANSAAILCMGGAHFDAVRAGIILYGYRPDGALDERFRPVMRFDSSVAHIHAVKRGEKISYGASYEAPRDMIVATVAAGYADGFERAYSGCEIVIRGKRYRQVGRICMDQCVIDVTPEDGGACEIKVGDAATLFGGDSGESVNALARLGGTINYEVLCRVSKRVPRVEI